MGWTVKIYVIPEIKYVGESSCSQTTRWCPWTGTTSSQKYLVGLVWSVLCEEGCFDDTCGDVKVLCLSYTYTVTDTVLLENSRFIWASKFYI
jgi:hypothetical protein